MVEISDIFDTEYLDNYPEHKEIRRSSMPIEPFSLLDRMRDSGLISYDDGRELNVDLDSYREMLLQNKRYPNPVLDEHGEYTHSGWAHPATIGNQEMDIDQLGLASFDLWKDLDANVWNASQKGLNREGLMGQYDDTSHDIFLNIDANRDIYDYAFPNEDWGKYSVLSHETGHPFTGPNPAKHLEEGTWVDMNEINPLLNLDWYDNPDEEIWSEGNVREDPIHEWHPWHPYDRIHNYLAWNAANYAGFSGYPEKSKSKTDEFGRVRQTTRGGPFVPHHNWKPTALDVTRMAELNDLARSWNEGTWQPINTRKESYISGNDPQKIGNMPRIDRDWNIPRTGWFAGNPHKDLINEFRRSKKTPQPKGTERFSTGGLVSLVL